MPPLASGRSAQLAFFPRRFFAGAAEIGIKFHDDVKVKKYKARKYDRDLAVGVVLEDDIDYYEVPDEVIVATPALKRHRYVYLNDHVYIVDSDRRIVAIVD
jgi:hypothetical protein